MQLNISFDSSVSGAPAAFKTALEVVAQYFDNVFTNAVAAPQLPQNVTINIDVGFGEIDGTALGAGDIGESVANISAVNASQFAAALDRAVPGDSAAVQHGLAAYANQTLVVATALQKTLGLSPASTAVDGFVGFSSSTNWNYSTTNRAVAGQQDFIGTAEHEITEAVGRGSSLGAGGAFEPVDLFRYASPNTVQTGTGGPSYFSRTEGAGGAPALAAGGNFNNDSVDPTADLNDWASGGPANAFNAAAPAGVMEPFSPNGSASDLDPSLMAAIGWEINPVALAAEPGLGHSSSPSPSPSPSPNPAPPPMIPTADMILRHSDGTFEIYDIAKNAVQAADNLGQVGLDFQIAGLGTFNGSDTTDMLLRSASTGAFQVYDISNNNVTASAALGQVGNDWQVAGFGDFGGPGASDMMMRNTQSGMFELYDIASNAVTSATALGAVGLDWQVAGFGNFGGPGASDMMLRNTQSGMFEVYDIASNQIVSATTLGAVGLDWQVAGFGNFGGPGASDMMLRNTQSGMFEVYDIANNQVVSATALGAVGLDWQVAGFGPAGGAGTSDMILRNTATGAFEVYDISNNQITAAAAIGQVGLDWTVEGVAVGPSIVSSSQQALLAQALAGFPQSQGAASTATAASPEEMASPLFAANALHR